MAIRIAEILTDGAAGVRGDVLHRRRIGSGRRNYDRIFHSAMLFECLDNLGDSGPLLANGDIDANHVLALLVDDRVKRDGCFARLAIADDQLALTAADRHHSVDRLDTGLQRLLHGLAVYYARRQPFERVELRGFNRAFAVDRMTECIDDAPNHGFADRDGHDAPGAAYLIAFFNARVIAQKNTADLVFFQVQRDAHRFRSKLD